MRKLRRWEKVRNMPLKTPLFMAMWVITAVVTDQTKDVTVGREFTIDFSTVAK